MSEGTLTVLGQLGGSASVKNGTLQFGNGVNGAASHLVGDLNIEGADSTLSVQGPATLHVDGTVNLHDNTVLDIAAGPNSPALVADSVILGDQVAFTLGGISHEGQLDKVLVTTRDGIQGDFASIQVGGFNGTVDYLNLNTHKSADQTQLLASYGLSWTANNNLAHGTFTLTDASNRFVVGTDLKDQTSNSATGWDGSSLHKAGAGTLVLSGQNSYTGGTTLADGRLEVSQDANLGAASGELRFQGGTLVATDSFSTARDIALLDAGKFEISQDNALDLNGTVSGAAELIKDGNGTLTLSGSNSYQGDTVLKQGTVQVARDANLGDSSSTLVFKGGTLATTDSFSSARSASFLEDASWQVADGTTLSLSGTISGIGALNKSGAGTLVLSGQNSYQGGTHVTDGTVQVSQDANLGDLQGQVSLNNGTLAVTDSFASARQIELEQTGTIAVNANTSLSLNGAITGTGSLEKTGTGTVVLAGTNTYEGGTTLHEGRVVVSQDSNLGSGALNFQGGTLATTDSFDSTRQITLNQAGHLDVAANTVLGLSGQISGSGNLIKEGEGTLRLSNTANRYGDTQILAGTLIGNASSLSGNVLNQGTLVFEQSSAGQFQGELSGAGSLLKTGAGTLVLSGQNSYTGGTTLADGRLEVSQDANLGAVSSELRFQGGTLVATDSFSTARDIALLDAGQFEINDDSTLDLNGTVSGTAELIKDGNGTLALSGNNSYQGDTVLKQGTVQVARDANLGDSSSKLVFKGGTLATSDSFSSARAASFLVDASWKVADSTALNLSGTLSGTGALNKSGAGTLVLSGQNSYQGGTSITDGTVQVSQDANLGDIQGQVSLNNGTLAVTDSFASARQIELEQTGTIAVNANTSLSLNGAITGIGSLEKTGTGTVILAGTNTYVGGTALHEGRVVVSQDSNLGSGALNFQGGTLATTDSFDSTRQLTLNQAGHLGVAANTVLGLSGQISGSGNLIKEGAGTLRLSNTANRYGNTQILAGTLIGNASSLSGNVLNQSALVFEQASAGRFQGELSGAGSLLKTGAGALTLSGNNSGYTGHSTVSEGTLAVLGKLGGSASVKNATLQFGDGVSGAASHLVGNLNIEGADSALSVQGPATLRVDGTVNLHDNTVLDIAAGPNSPALQAERVILGDQVAFALGGISHAGQLDKVLLSTRDGIQGDFASYQVGGFNGTVDYLNLNTHKSADQTQLLASYGLSWTANNNLAHGTFTLSDASNRFVVGTDLTDQTPNSTTGWNGNSLHKAGAGTLVLSGQNSYTGGTTLAGGRLEVSQDANLGAASSGLRFQGGTLVATDSFSTARDIALLDDGRVQVAADTTLTLAGAIVGHADLVKSGAGSLRLSNEANAYRNSRIEEGSLIAQAATLPGNVDNKGTLIFDQASDDTYAGGISGTGSLIKDGAGTLNLTGDSSAFKGTTTITAGKLVLNGHLGGSTTIGAGSMLAGSGVVGSGAGSNITVTQGGVLSPGNSIGTLTIDGNLNIEPGARLLVEADPGSTAADRIQVTGKTSLSGGSVAHIGANGSYDLRSSYTILTSEGGLSGEFGDVTSDFAFLNPSLSYDYQNGRVALVLERNDQAMTSAARTRNQQASAKAIESIGIQDRHAVYDAVAQLPNDIALLRDSFDSLSGELHASSKTVLQEDSRQIRDAVNERLRSASRAVAAQAAPVRNDQGQLSAADSSGTHSWIQGMGSWRNIDATDNTAHVSSSSSGFLMGVDTNVSDSTRLGLLAGYSRSDIKLRDRSSSASSDNYHLGAYGGTQWGALGLRGGLAYSWHDLSTSRSVSVPRLSSTLKADYSSQSAQAFAELGYRIKAEAVALEPLLK
ncbi:outer membrane autotransporter barrel domain-containing protein 9 [Alcaligenes sp. HPC1271]|nr:outer membrane autotransporter barrel domain-containing protein 9 [Alcaligenes sp. HPC1271]